MLVLFVLVPESAGAIGLRWSSGGSDLSFAAARECTLLVEAASGETLPLDWRLVWVTAGDSLGTPLVFQAESRASGDSAAACEILDPADHLAVLSNCVSARYCAAPGGGATNARLIFAAPAGTRGKLQVVAFVPAGPDSMQGTTLRSPEVTLNGGCELSYPPIIFRASSSHHLGRLDVRLAGANLGAVASVPISATDYSWGYPLAVTSRSDEAITAGAALAAPLPTFIARVADDQGAMALATLPADSFPPLDPIGICSSTFNGAQDTTNLLAKDFAFLNAGDTWHIFYTRQYQTSNYTDRTNTRRIGHAISTAQHLNTWTVVSDTAIQVREGKIWDNLHVWAPSIVLQGITYYMFYTGVQLDTLQNPPLIESEIQRIGIATSEDLTHWTQDAEPVFFNKKTSWAFRDSSQHGDAGWQFRDPFVMADPENPGHWLMYFVTVDSMLNQYVVGVARTPGTDLRTWQDVWPLRRTAATFMDADRDESPHAFLHHGNWWLMYTSTHYWGDQVTYSLNPSSPIDSASFTLPDSLKAITCGEHDFSTELNQWHGTEYVRIGANEYLGAWADVLLSSGVIKFSQIKPPDGTCPTDSLMLDCPDVWTGVDEAPGGGSAHPIALMLAGPCPARAVTSLRLVLHSSERVQVAIYDLLGRRVKTLFDGTAPAGAKTLSWDGRGERGTVAGSGIYFARAICPSGQSTARIPLIR
ncbi:MAG: hypothetical protein A2W29_04530 [Gemmatimonadetes bacterium RBG_16_66_8]|nr:MAG: hypothetical protein A2W29_04530 [Gemmatimonadetes bacterium RBG_16_66_8]